MCVRPGDIAIRPDEADVCLAAQTCASISASAQLARNFAAICHKYAQFSGGDPAFLATDYDRLEVVW